ncbi:MAG: PEP/pyruvate-binding domain-containing protein, partial [Chloroflexota bacterium]
AVRRCWASLWTGRAAVYRASNGIDPRTVRLAVVVQQMVDATVAGVLFTANPLTGRRRQAVIDASPGLGEAVVSGAVTPDHFVVNMATGQVVERQLGDKQVRIEALPGGGTRRVEGRNAGRDAAGEPCLSDAQLRDLARLGAQVERHFGAPQDIEWALDAGGTFWLTQSRPITTLFPLPANAPTSDADLRVYFSVNVAQGVYRPLTPMGIQGLRLLRAGIGSLWSGPPRDPAAGRPVLVEAAHRLFLDLTPVVRHSFGRQVARMLLGIAETRSQGILQRLFDDPRLAPVPTSPWRMARRWLPFLARTRFPLRIARALLNPAAVREEVARAGAAALLLGDVPPDARAADRLAALERLFSEGGPRIILAMLPLIPTGLGTFALAGRLLGDLATAEEKDVVRRGLPHNPTTEMDLQLWALAQQVRADAAAARLLADNAPEDLAAGYRAGRLPPVLQQGLAAFLGTYGHRGVAEIDLGVPRWGDDPTHILGALANYLRLEDTAKAPDVLFRQAAREAEAMAAKLAGRARRKGWLRGLAVRFLLNRGRQLAGLREAPKFYFVSLLTRARVLLRPVGQELAAAGRLDAPDDIYFVTLPEARVGLAGADLRPLVRELRASYAQELKRRHLPRILLSDGTEPGAEPQAIPTITAGADGVLRGTPASAGTITAMARVILDPQGARLEPGEILVAPSTDPGWTPLFLTAGGLVMEMGGPMSHGAVVAREYGIPAVVGVPGATERLTTGQRVTVDGAAGIITPAR